MKKNIVLFAAVFYVHFLSAQSLDGMWQNSHRLVAFDGDTATFILKLFYGWYYDKSAEFTSVTQKSDGSWETTISYPTVKETQIYPLALTDTELFLDFYIRGSAFLPQENSITNENGEVNGKLYGFWRCGGNKYEISIDESRSKSEVYSYFFTDKHAYKIRYWLTDVSYDEVSASVVDGDFSFNADKYLQIGGLVYTCVTGRGTSIRNVQKLAYTADSEGIVFSSSPSTKFSLYFASNETLMSFSNPYLKRADITDLNAEIAVMNARRRPARKPPFPPVNLEFYWEEIKKIRGGLGDTSGVLNFFAEGS